MTCTACRVNRYDNDKPGARRIPTARSSAIAKAAGTVPRRSRRKQDAEFFYRVAERLQQALPAKLPVIVRLGSPGPYCLGICRRKNSAFRICISSDISEAHAIDMLVHEYAHALAWPRKRDFHAAWCMPPSQRQRPFHGSDWGKAYAKVYCVVALDIIPAIHREQQSARRLKQRSRLK